MSSPIDYETVPLKSSKVEASSSPVRVWKKIAAGVMAGVAGVALMSSGGMDKVGMGEAALIACDQATCGGACVSWGTGCCAGKTFDYASEGCCGGKIFNTGNSLCCGYTVGVGVIYQNNNYECCDASTGSVCGPIDSQGGGCCTSF